MAGFAQPELRRVQRHLEGLDPVEVALRAVACLSPAQQVQLEQRFTEVFGCCTPPMRLSITKGEAE